MLLSYKEFDDFAKYLSEGKSAGWIYDTILLQFPKESMHDFEYYLNIKNAILYLDPSVVINSVTTNPDDCTMDSLEPWENCESPALQCAFDIADFLQDESEYLLETSITLRVIPNDFQLKGIFKELQDKEFCEFEGDTDWVKWFDPEEKSYTPFKVKWVHKTPKNVEIYQTLIHLLNEFISVRDYKHRLLTDYVAKRFLNVDNKDFQYGSFRRVIERYNKPKKKLNKDKFDLITNVVSRHMNSTCPTDI